MDFSQIYQSNTSPAISFEFFPPKPEVDLQPVKQLALDLASCDPRYMPKFMTVTYGAGGGTRARTKELAEYLNRESGVPVAAHLTCRGHSRTEIDQLLEELHGAGIRHLVALRGDPEKGQDRFVPHPEGFADARDLVAHIAKSKRFSIAVAGYPEGHRESRSLQADVDYLKSKVDQGAELVITQLFFDVSFFYRFFDMCCSAGINVPIVPGVLPVTGYKQVSRISEMCSATVPEKLSAVLQSFSSEADALKFGQDFTVEMLENLKASKVAGLHLYTLNRPEVMLPLMKRFSK